MAITITDTYLKPNGELRTGNRPLFLILFDSGRSNYSIYDMDLDDKHEHGKVMFRGHFFVTKSGNIFRGRPINTFGEFAYDDKKNVNFDTNGVGICVEGDYTSELMPTVQKNAISILIQDLMNEYKEIRMIYGLDELVSEIDNPGVLFPLNEIVALVTGTSVESKRIAPNGYTRFAFESRTLYYDPVKPIKGNDVTELQFILNLLGFECDSTSTFDATTLNAVINFQRSHNIVPDGVVSDITFDYIKRLSMKFYESKTTFNRILRITQPDFMYGEDVKLLQMRLNLLGYKCPQNSFYDEDTYNAVRNFQEIYSLTPDGKVGPITWTQITSSDYDFIKRTLAYSVPMIYGDDIKLVQQRLNDLGFTIGNPSGWYDEITRQQVLNFQKSKTIKADGVVDDATAKALFK